MFLSVSKMRVRVKMIVFVQTHGWPVLLRRPFCTIVIIGQYYAQSFI